MSEQREPPLILRALLDLWRAGGALTLTGRLVAVLLGLVLTVVGIVLILTDVGVEMGLPLALTGMLLVLWGMFQH